jgi:pimeloyl-ACP methyl ester carboxylesterase
VSLTRWSRGVVAVVLFIGVMSAAGMAGAGWFIRYRTGFDVTTYNQIRDASSLRAPILLFQDGQETFVPPDRAASLAQARPDLVEYHFFPDAGHTSWAHSQSR